MSIIVRPLPPLSDDDARWFWSCVKVGPPQECWDVRPGVGSRDGDGYARLRLPGRDRLVLAHRVALALDGRDPGRQLGLHLCDRPSCVSPHHLVVGDALENARQREARGRRRPGRGGDSPSARLTWREAAALRRAKAAGVSAEILATAFGVSRSTVFAVCSGRAYATTISDGDA